MGDYQNDCALISQAAFGTPVAESDIKGMVRHMGSHPIKPSMLAEPTSIGGKFACELKESPHQSMSNVCGRPDASCTVCLKKACTKRTQEEKEEFDKLVESIKQKLSRNHPS